MVNYPVLQSELNQHIITGTFLEAWEEMLSLAEEGRSNHAYKMDYKIMYPM